MRQIGALLLAVALTSVGAAQARRTSLTGNVKHVTFHSDILRNDRNLIIYLPPDYDRQSRERYPVVYMGDGQNVMDGMTSFIPNQEWRADEAAESLIRARLILPVIIVGIDNAGAERANEYLPTQMKQPNGSTWGGRADRFADMLLRELKPMIDRTYRTRPDRENTAFIGSSFGGMLALHLGLTHPETFGRLGVISPSIWWDGRVILKEIDAYAKSERPRIWLDIGTDENRDAVKDTADAADALTKKGWKPGKSLVFYVDGGAAHNELAWARRIPAVLMFLFGTH